MNVYKNMSKKIFKIQSKERLEGGVTDSGDRKQAYGPLTFSSHIYFVSTTPLGSAGLLAGDVFGVCRGDVVGLRNALDDGAGDVRVSSVSLIRPVRPGHPVAGTAGLLVCIADGVGRPTRIRGRRDGPVRSVLDGADGNVSRDNRSSFLGVPGGGVDGVTRRRDRIRCRLIRKGGQRCADERGQDHEQLFHGSRWYGVSVDDEVTCLSVTLAQTN